MAHIPVVFLVITKLIAFSKGYILCGTKRSPKMNGDKNNNLFSMVLRSFNWFLLGKVKQNVFHYHLGTRRHTDRLVKDLAIVFLFLWLLAFWSLGFFARKQRLKNGWPLSAPPRAYFWHSQLPKKIFGERWNQTAFIKKKWEVLMKIEGIHALSKSSGHF